MCALKRATFSGGVLFRFQRQPSLAGAEDAGQIFSDIYAVCLCGVDNRIGSSTGVSSFRRGGKQPVFPADDKKFYVTLIVYSRNFYYFECLLYGGISKLMSVQSISYMFSFYTAILRLHKIVDCVELLAY